MDTKMDWMYKGNQTVNREEYLLGRPVDKAFEQMQQTEKETEQNRVPKNHVEYECIPPSLRFFSGNEQVDLARKMQEDPLYAIKKKEIETRNQLLKNPVKLKQLRELLEQQSSKGKHKKSKKKSRKDSSEDEAKLDMLLATKYNHLKNNITEKDLLKSIKKLKHKQKKKSKKHSRSSKSESDSTDNDVPAKEKRHKRRKKRKKSITDNSSDSSDSDSSDECKAKTKKKTDNKKLTEYAERIDDDKKEDRKRRSSKNRDAEKEESKRYKEEHNGHYRHDDRHKDGRTNRHTDDRRYSMKKRNDRTISDKDRTLDSKSSCNTDNVKFKDARKEEKYRSKAKLTEEEKEKRLRDMMENAVWRDKEREKNVKLHRETEQKETEDSKLYNKDFIRKQLVVATEMSTVASRIKSNINNIQRSGRAMDTNFAKR